MPRFLAFLLLTANALIRVAAFSLHPTAVRRSPTASSMVSSRLGVSSDSSNDGSLFFTPEVSRREAWATAAQVSAAGLILPPFSAGAAELAVPTVKLGNGSLEVTRTIQGQWQLAGGHGRYRESEALENMKAHFDAGITTLDTADIYGPSEIIVGKFVKSQPKAIPCTKFCCFRYLEEIDRAEVRLRIQKVRTEQVKHGVR